jgi:hypothetical protein
MAPVPLQPHSCAHCQRLVIDIRGHPRPDIDFAHFQFNMRDILAAAADDCRFCQWLLDEEWVHYLALADAICRGSNNPQAVLPPSVFGIVMEIAIRNDDRLPPPNPRSTLSHLAEEHRRVLFGSGAGQFHDLTLACFPYQGLEIKFFGLWDPFARTMACRTRHGFSIFTTSSKSVLFHYHILLYVVL